ncbi:neoverrucotoxin subunit alpha-like [Tubulanus polymorphus]|uniref:neoverrucotoxin subunit alpha-like n=1 Tax=Tubulanus polymorphus TaxID=672921 RepID=UPI003DA23061
MATVLIVTWLLTVATAPTLSLDNLAGSTQERSESVSFRKRSVPEKRDVNLNEMVLPLLGRPAFLGSLYDARSERILSNYIWNRQTITAKSLKQMKISSKTNFFAAKTITDRFSVLDLTAELKLSILGGLITVSGNAAFLRESRTKENEESYSLAYDATTRIEAMPIHPPDIVRSCKSAATHVVSALEYGMGVTMTFRRKVSNSERRQHVKGQLQALVKSIPSVEISGNANADIDEKTRKFAETVNIDLYGDASVRKPPSTYEDAIKTYSNLASTLGEAPNYATSIPIRMHLTPKDRYCTAKTVALYEISEQMTTKVTNVLIELDQCHDEINNLYERDSVRNLSQIRTVLSNLKDKLVTFKSRIKERLTGALRQARTNGSYRRINNVLTMIRRSQFDPVKLAAFVGKRKREIMAVQVIFDFIQNEISAGTITLYDYGSAFDVVGTAVVTEFHLNLLQSADVLDEYLSGTESKSVGWFDEPRKIADVGNRFKRFIEYVKENAADDDKKFFVKITEADDEKPVTILAYHDDRKVNFNPIAETPAKLLPVHIEYGSVTFNVTRPENQDISSCQILQKKYGTDDVQETLHRLTTGENTLTVNVEPSTAYTLKMKYITSLGRSVASVESDPIFTSASGPPTNLEAISITTTGLMLRWVAPLGITKPINQYLITGSTCPGGKLSVNIRTTETSAAIGDLLPSTSYNFHVKAIFAEITNGDATIIPESLPSVTLEVQTGPVAPAKPRATSIGESTVNIVWTPLPSYKNMRVEYTACYRPQISPSSRNCITTANPWAKITGLGLDKTYLIYVRMLFNGVTSDFSESLIVKTNEKDMFTKVKDLEDTVDFIRDHFAGISEFLRTPNVEPKDNSVGSNLSLTLEQCMDRCLKSRTCDAIVVGPTGIPCRILDEFTGEAILTGRVIPSELYDMYWRKATYVNTIVV